MITRWVAMVCVCLLAAKFSAEVAVFVRRHPVHVTPTVALMPSKRYREYRDRRLADLWEPAANVVPRAVAAQYLHVAADGN